MKFALVIALVSAAEKQVCDSALTDDVTNFTADTADAAKCGESCTAAVTALGETEAAKLDMCCQYSLAKDADATAATCTFKSRAAAAADAWATTMKDETADSGTNQAWEWKAGVAPAAETTDGDATTDDKTEEGDADSAKALAASLFATAALAMAY